MSLSELGTILPQKAGWCLNGEPQTTWLGYVSNAALLSLKLLLFADWNISSEKWL